MPIFNGAAQLRDTIASVQDQTLENWELLAIDDGSTDPTWNLLEELAAKDCRVTPLRQENGGITRALNFGASRIRGKFVARLDCGDFCKPSRFEKQVAFLTENPDFVAVGCFAERLSSEGYLIDIYRPPLTHEEIDNGHILGGSGGLVHVSAMIRAKSFRDVGYYREKFRYAQDTDLWLRLAEIGKLANLPQVLTQYEIALTGISATKRKDQAEFSRLAVDEARARRGLTPLQKTSEPWVPQDDRDFLEKWARDAYAAGNCRSAASFARRAFLKKPSLLMLKIYVRSIMAGPRSKLRRSKP